MCAGLTVGAHFRAVFAVSAHSAHREKTELIAQALQHFGIVAREAVMIGDRHFDIEGARANGVRAIGAAWGFGSREELRMAGADAIAETPAQLAKLLAAA